MKNELDFAMIYMDWIFVTFMGIFFILSVFMYNYLYCVLFIHLVLSTFVEL